ncbi:hypothetical protein JCM6882_004843 [Rhodosporidiobolus microsporus]
MVLYPSPATKELLPLHRHASSIPLLRLLRPHLPHALPLYSTLHTPGDDVPAWASFATSATEDQAAFSRPWFVLADLGNQLRFFCSAETDANLTEDAKAEAEELIAKSFRWYLTAHARGRTVIRIGAIPDLFTSAIERAFSKPFYPSNIHYQLLPPPPTDPSPLSAATTFPEGISVVEAEEGHIEQILSTSDVPHPPSYLLTRLAHTTALIHSPSSSPSRSSSSSPSDPSVPLPASSPASLELVAHCTTHRDGSIGTVHVSPSFRQKGLGTLLVRARMEAMALDPCPSSDVEKREGEGQSLERYAFCYVSPQNEKSQALMRRLGMKRTEWAVSWAVVELPLVDEHDA